MLARIHVHSRQYYKCLGYVLPILIRMPIDIHVNVVKRTLTNVEVKPLAKAQVTLCPV